MPNISDDMVLHNSNDMVKKREIRNNTAEFLTFVAEGKENGIQVLYKDETVWATQKSDGTAV